MAQMQRYQTLGYGAVEAWNRGNHREAADKYLAAFQIAPSKNESMRWQLFHGFSSILREGYFTPKQSDLDALRAIATDVKEIKAFRCEAFFALGLLLWEANERDDAADMYRQCIRVGKKAKGLDRSEMIISTVVNPRTGTPVLDNQKAGKIIDKIVKDATGNLEKMENPNLCTNLNDMMDGQPLTFRRSDGTIAPNTVRGTFVGIGPNPTTMTKEIMNRLLTVGGNKCDGCHKDIKELGSKRLLSCSRCAQVYYCGQECQRKAWKSGHKEFCRKKGEFKSDDYVRLHSIVSSSELNGQVVEIIRPHPNAEDKWEVKVPGGEKSFYVSGQKMETLCPLK